MFLSECYLSQLSSCYDSNSTNECCNCWCVLYLQPRVYPKDLPSRPRLVHKDLKTPLLTGLSISNTSRLAVVSTPTATGMLRSITATITNGAATTEMNALSALNAGLSAGLYVYRVRHTTRSNGLGWGYLQFHELQGRRHAQKYQLTFPWGQDWR